MFNEEALKKIVQEILELSSDTSSDEYEFYRGNVAFLKFFGDEVMQMPKEFRKQFRAQGSTAHIRKDIFNGKSSYTIRFRHFGYFIEVKGNDLKALKMEFIKQVNLKYGESDNVRRLARSVVRGLQKAEFTTE